MDAILVDGQPPQREIRKIPHHHYPPPSLWLRQPPVVTEGVGVGRWLGFLFYIYVFSYRRV